MSLLRHRSFIVGMLMLALPVLQGCDPCRWCDRQAKPVGLLSHQKSLLVVDRKAIPEAGLVYSEFDADMNLVRSSRLEREMGTAQVRTARSLREGGSKEFELQRVALAPGNPVDAGPVERYANFPRDPDRIGVLMPEMIGVVTERHDLSGGGYKLKTIELAICDDDGCDCLIGTGCGGGVLLSNLRKQFASMNWRKYCTATSDKDSVCKVVAGTRTSFDCECEPQAPPDNAPNAD